MSLRYPDYLLSDDFSVNVINSIFTVISILLFIAIVLTINNLRHRFSATTCFELGVLLFSFVVAVDEEIRLLVYEYFLAPIIDSLLLSLSKLSEILGTI